MSATVTLVELLHARAQTSLNDITFLNDEGHSASVLSYAELYRTGLRLSYALRQSGLVPGTSNVVLARFDDVRKSILTFWACCLAGVPFCPLPAAHPDPSHQKALLEHLHSLFPKVTVVTDAAGRAHTSELLPSLKAIMFGDLLTTAATMNVTSEVSHHPGPSDVVALMLTSGSTGKPKAVVLRHSTILSSCRGKTAHHGTSSNTPLFNWIAFDHVASLTEIHVHALLIDAPQYHISAAAIVRRPCLLLELFNQYRVGFSFSPNFLLARIIQDAAQTPLNASVDLSCLRAIISGGEAVPIKTAITFADLLEKHGAPRDVLRAGFGMSETGAGTIYNRDPVIRDAAATDAQFLSLGDCAPGIEMRVVDNDSGEPVSSGEIGALQVRGPSVFNEYFGNPAATKESFTEDGWFITGDLGLFDARGMLHLTGRGKDVLNVNGLKMSTTEIETYIFDAAIAGITAGMVYVCPIRLEGAETETYVVFYEQDGIDVSKDISDKDVAAIRATTSAIRATCIVVCSQAPHVILPLPAADLAKSTIGKVSRPKLVKAYQGGNYACIVEQLAREVCIAPDNLLPESEVSAAVIECITDAFEENVTIHSATNLFDLGATSMHLIRMKHGLQERLHLSEIPTIELLRRPLVGDMIQYLQRLQNPCAASESTYDPIVRLNHQGSKPPVFLVHPGVGEVLVFINLARTLADDRPVYGIRTRGFDQGETMFATWDEMIKTYTDGVEAAYPSGPYYISGYSFGGPVAFEIAKMLESRGRTVQWLGILDAPVNIQARMREIVWPHLMLTACMLLSLIPVASLENHRRALVDAYPDIWRVDEEPVNAVEVAQWTLNRCNPERLADLDIKDASALLHWVRVAYDLTRTGRTFEPRGTTNAALTTIFSATTRTVFGETFDSWRAMTKGGYEMVDVDGDHYTIISDDNVGQFANKMRAALHRADTEGRATHTTVKKSVSPVIPFTISGRFSVAIKA